MEIWVCAARAQNKSRVPVKWTWLASLHGLLGANYPLYDEHTSRSIKLKWNTKLLSLLCWLPWTAIAHMMTEESPQRERGTESAINITQTAQSWKSDVEKTRMAKRRIAEANNRERQTNTVASMGITRRICWPNKVCVSPAARTCCKHIFFPVKSIFHFAAARWRPATMPPTRPATYGQRTY